MRRDIRTAGRAPRGQRGIGLMAAIFLVVVVAGLSVAIARMVRTSSDSFGQDLTAQRARLSAEAGAELALNRVFAPSGTGSCSDRVWVLDGIGLAGCSARVTCRADVVSGEPNYTLQSAGRCDAGSVVAERHLLVRASP